MAATANEISGFQFTSRSLLCALKDAECFLAHHRRLKTQFTDKEACDLDELFKLVSFAFHFCSEVVRTCSAIFGGVRELSERAAEATLSEIFLKLEHFTIDETRTRLLQCLGPSESHNHYLFDCRRMIETANPDRPWDLVELRHGHPQCMSITCTWETGEKTPDGKPLGASHMGFVVFRRTSSGMLEIAISNFGDFSAENHENVSNNDDQIFLKLFHPVTVDDKSAIVDDLAQWLLDMGDLLSQTFASRQEAQAKWKQVVYDQPATFLKPYAAGEYNNAETHTFRRKQIIANCTVYNLLAAIDWALRTRGGLARQVIRNIDALLCGNTLDCRFDLVR